MVDLIDKIQKMIHQLESCPNIEVFDIYIPSPAREIEFLRAEKYLNGCLPKDIRDFYSICNGLQIRWYYKTGEKIQVAQKTNGNGFDPLEMRAEKWQADGIINILPIQDIFCEDKLWENQIYFDSMKNNNPADYETLKKIRPLDYFSDFSCVSCLCYPLPFTDYPVLTLGTDFHADYSYKTYFTFHSYLNHCIHNFCLVSARDILRAKDHAKTSILHDPISTQSPTLEEICIKAY